MATRITDNVFEYCTSYTSVTEEYAKLLKSDPHSASPGKAASKLFGHHEMSISGPPLPKERSAVTPEELERAYRCGKWGEQDKGTTRPSELFLRMYHDALCTLDKDPLIGCVSPSVMGSCGTLPLTIIAPLPDICRHMVS
jgi:hypothetical protein